MYLFLFAVAGIVESVKWAFTASSASWESAAIATSAIFLGGAPVLLAGLSLSGYACAYLLGLLTWRAFGWQGTFIVSVYFVLVSTVPFCVVESSLPIEELPILSMDLW